MRHLSLAEAPYFLKGKGVSNNEKRTLILDLFSLSQNGNMLETDLSLPERDGINPMTRN